MSADQPTTSGEPHGDDPDAVGQRETADAKPSVEAARAVDHVLQPDPARGAATEGGRTASAPAGAGADERTTGNPGNPWGRTNAACDERTGLTPLERAAAQHVIAGVAPQVAARLAGYRDPISAGKHLRRKLAFTDFCLAHMREKMVRYHEILELAKRNIVFLLSDDDTPEHVRGTLSIGVLRVLAKAGRDGKSLIERALDEDKVEADPRTIAARLIAATTPTPVDPMPGSPTVIDAEVIQ